MKYYYSRENRVIETEELLRKYGSFVAVPQLGIYELSVQPDYVPVGFNPVGAGVYYPVKSYEDMQNAAITALIAAGYSKEEAVALLA